jgi:uncharacterized membrane protein
VDHEPHGGGATPERRIRRDGVVRARSERDRLDIPRYPGRSFRPRYDPELFGRFAEAFARFMGTARFLAYMTGFVVVWITINLVGIFGLHWDPYPFILLNLFFSTQASYAAPLILLAQNRQEARDRVQYEQDRDMNTRTRADMEFLAREVASLRLAMGEVATRDFLRSELRTLLAEITEADHDEGGASAGHGEGAGGRADGGGHSGGGRHGGGHSGSGRHGARDHGERDHGGDPRGRENPGGRPGSGRTTGPP